MKPNPEIMGWADDIYPFFDEIASRIPLNGTYLEIGTFLGASLVHMGTLRPDLRLIAVDPWIDEPKGGWAGLSIYEDVVKQHGGLWFAFLEIMKRHAPDVLNKTQVIRGTSETVWIRESIDLLFIDGAHNVESVGNDLAEYAHLVKPGGIVAGHDYHHDFPGVVEAVDAWYPNVNVRGTCWWVQK